MKTLSNENIKKAYIAAIVLNTFDLYNVKESDITILRDAYNSYENNDDEDEVDVDEDIAEAVNCFKDDKISDYISNDNPVIDIIDNNMIYDLILDIDSIKKSEPTKAKYCDYAMHAIYKYLTSYESAFKSWDGTDWYFGIVEEFEEYVKRSHNGFGYNAEHIVSIAEDDSIIDDCRSYYVYNDGDIDEDAVTDVAERHEASADYIKDFIMKHLDEICA